LPERSEARDGRPLDERLHLTRRTLARFHELDDYELEALAATFDETRVLLHRGSPWAREGESGYVVLEGWLVRSLTLPDGRRQIVDFLLPGDIVGCFARGEDSGVEEVSTLTVARVAPLPGARLRALREDCCDLAFALVAASASGYDRLMDQVLRLGQLAAYERTAHLMLDLLLRLRRVGLASGDHYSLPMTQGELADALGLSQVHLNRVIRAMTRDRLVEIRGRAARTSITVCSVHRLAQVAGYDVNRLPPGHA
jgi:CRP-like cAMP-binding protein